MSWICRSLLASSSGRSATALRLLFAVTLLSAMAACGSAVESTLPEPERTLSTAAGPQPKMVIFAIDGPRYTETFGDTAHAWIPRMWNDMRPQGTILTNFQNLGGTSTVPGHSTIVTGTWQVLANDGTERPDRPTVFEYYRQWLAAPGSQTYVISGKAKLDVCAYGTYPGYGASFAATALAGYASDGAVYDDLISVLQNQQPRLVLVCLPQVDWSAHGGVWEEYLAALVGADSLAWKTWNYLQSDPFYAGQTYLFVTNDHGRHDDAHGGFASHGDGCPGCRHLMFLALGPDIRAGHTVDALFTQRDICKTAGQILGIPTPHAEGNVIEDIFEPVPTGVRMTAGRAPR